MAQLLIQSIKKSGKTSFFVFFKKGTPSVTFFKKIALPLIWSNKINFFVNTQLG
jgi:hypothetical protein